MKFAEVIELSRREILVSPCATERSVRNDGCQSETCCEVIHARSNSPITLHANSQ